MNPSYKLQVIGTGSFSSVRITDGAASGRVLRSDPTGNAYWSDGALATVTNAGNIIG